MIIKVGALEIEAVIRSEGSSVFKINIKAHPSTYSQDNFESDLRALCELLSRLTPPVELLFRAGARFVIPNFFKKFCASLGINIEVIGVHRERSQPRLWRMLPGTEPHREEFMQWFKAEGLIALGWGWTDDLNHVNPTNQHAIAALIPEHAPGTGGRCLWDFWHEMTAGDIVILRDGKNIVGLVTIGDYYFDNTYSSHASQFIRGQKYYHRRQAYPAVGGIARAINIWNATKEAPGANGRFHVCERVIRCQVP